MRTIEMKGYEGVSQFSPLFKVFPWTSPLSLSIYIYVDWNILFFTHLLSVIQEIVTRFESLSGITVLKKWDSRVTHVIASVDENGACRRTLKYLMGILEGKWILTIDCKHIPSCILITTFFLFCCVLIIFWGSHIVCD